MSYSELFIRLIVKEIAAEFTYFGTSKLRFSSSNIPLVHLCQLPFRLNTTHITPSAPCSGHTDDLGDNIDSRSRGQEGRVPNIEVEYW
jgi:hypothetical protein